ncbi:cell division protein SepF [Terracoccus luteus]|uniref:Cell division protein SepF n=1 Tax=Terracoccus luteus TaxID=53356 RepID=A0A495XWH6_9MICO|nr:cell division protein SepF [Terracoccus luteus]MBB2987139.1 cell division inhibitor SepF [Terracoccus luteus]MCP2172790.1 cell division inhibitor SepF [Terracoccus luteus]RKT77184.1 cell division inhibitor SepF [Terracoccus luteus]
MAGALRKTMVYLGLSEEDPRAQQRYDDDGYDEHDAYDEPEHTAAVTQLPTKRPVAAVVRETEVGGLSRITTIHPRTYNEAKNIGEWFRDQVPVIMNLSDMDDADAKRLVDFAAGLVFGLHGTIERVTSKVFLLSPAHVEVAADEPEAPVATTRNFFNQS